MGFEKEENNPQGALAVLKQTEPLAGFQSLRSREESDLPIVIYF